MGWGTGKGSSGDGNGQHRGGKDLGARRPSDDTVKPKPAPKHKKDDDA
ncbi:hypothetical protein ACFU99_09195 [Streptomyces sp. NPDC057654]